MSEYLFYQLVIISQIYVKYMSYCDAEISQLNIAHTYIYIWYHMVSAKFNSGSAIIPVKKRHHNKSQLISQVTS